MLPASHPLLYACVFRDSALVAEVAHAPYTGGAGGEADLPAVAAALAAAAPLHHRYVTHSAVWRAHALLLAPPLTLVAVSLAPQLPASHLLLFLRRLRCLPEPRMLDEMPRLVLRLPFPDEEALAREEGEVAAAEAEAEEAVRREGELARMTPKRERGGGWTWRRQLWLVILVDLVLLCVLFAAWLAVCRGFSCIDGIEEAVLKLSGLGFLARALLSAIKLFWTILQCCQNFDFEQAAQVSSENLEVIYAFSPDAWAMESGGDIITWS